MRNFGKLLFRLGNKQGLNIIKQKLINQENLSRKVLISGLSTLGLSFFYGMNTVAMDSFYEKTIQADFEEGEKRAIQVGPKEEDTVLVVKLDGKYYCVSEKCSHFGFGLSKGYMVEDKIVCPLHLAQFSVITGQNEYGPVLDGLEKFEITEENGLLHIKVPISKLNNKKTFTMSRRGNDERRFVIIGGGPAAISAAETLRQSGFEGHITILSKEQSFPYDRTILSKNIQGVQLDKITFRTKEFFDNYDINFHGHSEVEKVNLKTKSIQLKGNHSHIHFDQLLIATGGRPRVPKIEGTKLQNVFTIRDFHDIEQLRQSLVGKKKIVIIGASFIGLESASSLKMVDKNLDITIVDVSQAPLEKVVGKQVGKSVQQLHENNGIKFKLQTSLVKLQGNENEQVSKVILSTKEEIDADIVILGTGMQPNTDFLEKTQQVKRDIYGGIQTNVYHETTALDVFAAGDVATYPYFYSGENIRVEHFNEAIYQGHVAALNMLGKKVPNDNIPFFWTRFWNNSLQYTGNTSNFDDIHIEGDLNTQKFLAYYFLNNRVVAAAAMGMIPHISVIQEAMKHQVLPTAEDIKTGRVTLEDIKKKVKSQGKACRCQRSGRCKKRQQQEQTQQQASAQQ